MQRVGLIVLTQQNTPQDEMAIQDYLKACFIDDATRPDVNTSFNYSLSSAAATSPRVGRWMIHLIDLHIEPELPMLKGNLQVIIEAPEDQLPNWESLTELRYIALKQELDAGVMHVPILAQSTGMELQAFSYDLAQLTPDQTLIEWFTTGLQRKEEKTTRTALH